MAKAEKVSIFFKGGVGQRRASGLSVGARLGQTGARSVPRRDSGFDIDGWSHTPYQRSLFYLRIPKLVVSCMLRESVL